MKLHALGFALLGSVALSGANAQQTSHDAANHEQPAAVAPAPAPEPAAPAEAPAAAEVARGEEVVCRTDRATGSLTRRNRVCMTRNEWTLANERMRADVAGVLPRSASGIPDGQT